MKYWKYLQMIQISIICLIIFYKTKFQKLVELCFFLFFFNSVENEANDWNLLLSGWWMEVLDFYRIWDLIIQSKTETNDWNLLLSGWWMEVLDFYKIWDLIIHLKKLKQMTETYSYLDGEWKY